MQFYNKRVNKLLTQIEGFDFRFDSAQCSSCGGKCCIGKSGNIWITVQELSRLAKYLGVSFDELMQKYVEKRGYRFSIKEAQIDLGNYRCIFFDMEKKQCSIYNLRPRQCRTFPFWNDLKDDIEYLKNECIGVVI